jgi:ankyrin repeat protein
MTKEEKMFPLDIRDIK